MGALKDLGFLLYVDDAGAPGTDHAVEKLQTPRAKELLKLFDVVKIDGHFVSGPNPKNGAEYVQTKSNKNTIKQIIEIGQGANPDIKFVAERVETEQQRKELEDLVAAATHPCEISGQGYL